MVAPIDLGRRLSVYQTYRIFTDGSAIGNPGPGGWGAVLMQGKRRWEMSGAFPWTTISEMELVAAVKALRQASKPGARRAAFGLGIPDLWNASLRLPLATPRLAKPTRKPTAAPRVVVGTDRVECQASHPLDMDQRAQRKSGAGPRRQRWHIRPLALSGCNRRPRLDAGKVLTLSQKEKH